MNSIYNKSVQSVPENLTEPTPTYKRHVWLALAGIVGFFVFYLALTFWFFFSAKHLFTDAYYGSESPLLTVGLGLGCAFLAIFMIKAFFFVATKFEHDGKEIQEKEEPLLFDYLYKLADEAGAPRPHKVYLSNRVNASVFYPLSILNLFWPSKKNLEIGLGLINVLNMGEFKAVLAHEFGHFAQRSMLVGRWVYIANQIANTVIGKRDVLDSFLSGLSRIDIRIAWIGWILSLVVWSIRSIVELFFRIVVLSQRALSREMEFQADLVAVSVTGSDALIHALHKLQAADQAFSSALNSVNKELQDKKAVEDVYALQTNSIEKTALILDDDTYGESPKVPAEHPENFRVFTNRIAQPPKMWSTHPPDQEREANAKKTYIPGNIDDRSAWDLFSNPDLIKKQMTAKLIASAKLETELKPTADCIKNQNLQYEKSYFNSKYRGVYLSRFFCQNYQNVEDLYLAESETPEPKSVISKIYPESLVEDLEDYNTLLEEFHQLEAIHHKRLESTGNGIWHRGVQVRRKELPQILKTVSSEVDTARDRVAAHDRLVRSAHLSMAKKIGNGWPEYLQSLLKVIHYSEHSIANMNDSHKILAQVVQVVMADGRVTSSEMVELLSACNDLHRVLDDLNIAAPNLVLDVQLQMAMGVESWRKRLEPLGVGFADQQNINHWMNVIDGWVGVYREAFEHLRSEALSTLLVSEEQVQKITLEGNSKAAPTPTKIGFDYQTLLPGAERPMKMNLSMWDKFISAEGIVPGALKFLVAASIVGATVFAVNSVEQAEITVYNGLAEPVNVSIGNQNIRLQPHKYRSLKLKPGNHMLVEAKNEDGMLIEAFEPSISSNSGHYVYNVANAAAMINYTVIYDGKTDAVPNMLGSKRWFLSNAKHIFTEPPTNAEQGSRRKVLTALSSENPETILSTLEDETDAENMIRIHAKWDGGDSPHITSWLQEAGRLSDFEEIMLNRLAQRPNEVVAVRSLQEFGGEEMREKYCTKYTQLNQSEPNNADIYYLSARCIEDEESQKKRFMAGHESWPNHPWLAYASAYELSSERKWQEALRAMKVAIDNAPSLSEALLIESERIARLLESQGTNNVERPNQSNDYISSMNSIKSGLSPEIKNGPQYAFHLLQKGSLEEAVNHTNSYPAYANSITSFAACSRGAKKDWIETALNLNPETELGNAAFQVYGLAVREGRSTEKYFAAFKNIDEDLPDQIKKLTDAVLAKDFRTAKEEMNFGNVWYRGNLIALACVILGEEAPKEWVSDVNAFLFCVERAYL